MSEISEKVLCSNILVVGAGGIGCELLKNLVLTGFTNIDIIDLDTIDVSNLNRQFLFHKLHVGKPKSLVAADSVRQFASSAVNIHAFHNNILCSEFDVNFFKKYSIVLNALDNRAARNHVNRMCLATDIPLVESGSAGYLGQVTVIKKGETECYECTPKPAQKTYPGCTIRNTPSEPIHCIVWAKHLFNQLFGEAEIDEDVSPDMADPEAVEGDGETVNGSTSDMANGLASGNTDSSDGEAEGVQQRISTRKWAIENKYDPEVLFNKLFRDDIEYLLTMANLWKKRRPPTPLDWNDLPDMVPGSSSEPSPGMKDQQVWSPSTCKTVFEKCVLALKKQLEEQPAGSVLVWDKDDDVAMDFVTCCANFRSFVFGISMKSRFDIKSMAGNIIPAIATTNAVVAAMIVVEALKVLAGNFHKCKTCFIVRKANPKGKILVDTALYPPNPKCYVCSKKPEVAVELNTKTFTVKSLEEKILKQTLNMVAPDVNIADGSGSVIISSEEGETDGLAHKSLCEVRVVDGTRLMCDDFMQHFELRLIIHHSDSLPVDEEFRLINDPFNIKAEETPEIQVKGISAKNDDEGETEIVEDSPLKLKAGQKRAAPDDGGSDFADDAKRVRTNC